jgi:hypothetical protein
MVIFPLGSLKDAAMANADNGKRALSNELLEEIRKQAISQAAIWSVAAIGSLALIGGTGWWLYFRPALSASLGGLPGNAVVAFDLPTGCPAGWKEFEPAISRTIVGATRGQAASPNHDVNGRVLSARLYRQDGGEESHILTIEELPPHNHGIENIQHSEYLREEGRGYIGTEVVGRESSAPDPKAPIRYTETAGSGHSHNIMPPFVALYYCIKDN